MGRSGSGGERTFARQRRGKAAKRPGSEEVKATRTPRQDSPCSEDGQIIDGGQCAIWLAGAAVRMAGNIARKASETDEFLNTHGKSHRGKLQQDSSRGPTGWLYVSSAKCSVRLSRNISG